MAALLQTTRVKYECSCGLPFPLDELYFCRTCVKLKCVECTQQFVDNIICQGCFETATVGENRERVGRCPSCYMCPICSTVLMSRSINNKFRLQCTYCRFNTLDAGIEDQVDNDKWKLPSSSNADFFQNIRSKMLEYAEFDRFEHERLPDKRRRSTVNPSFLSDKYGLNTIFNQRKKSGYTGRPAPMEVEHTKVSDVEELSLEEIMAPVENPLDVHSFSEQLQSLSSTEDRWLPEALPVLPRRTVRCGESENSLVKAEYNPLSITFRMRYLAFTYVPDIRMYRPPVITILTQSYVLIYVSNYSNVHVTARVSPVNVEDDDNYVSSVLNKEVVVPLPPPNTIQDIEDQLQFEGNPPGPVDTSKPFYENIIFKRRHQAALTIPVHAKKITDHNYLKLRMEVEFDNLAPANPDKSISRPSLDRNYSNSYLSRTSSMADTSIPPTPTPDANTSNAAGADKPKVPLSHPITITIDIGRTIDDNIYDCDIEGNLSGPLRIPAELVFA